MFINRVASPSICPATILLGSPLILLFAITAYVLRMKLVFFKLP